MDFGAAGEREIGSSSGVRGETGCRDWTVINQPHPAQTCRSPVAQTPRRSLRFSAIGASRSIFMCRMAAVRDKADVALSNYSAFVFALILMAYLDALSCAFKAANEAGQNSAAIAWSSCSETSERTPSAAVGMPIV